MSKLTWFGAVALAVLAAQPAMALTLQNFGSPDGAAQFTDPDEKRPFSAGSKQEDEQGGQGFDMWRGKSDGLRFSISGGNRDNPAFVPGLTVPRQFGPTYDPQTHDPYPR